jgi:hypothetical protein
MSYPLIAFLVAFVTVYVVPVVGAMIDKDSEIKPIALNNFIAALAYFVILWICLWGDAGGFYGPTPYFWSISIGLAIGAVVAGLTNDDFSTPSIIPVVLIIIYIIVGAGSNVFSWDMFRAGDKVRLIGEVKIVEDVSSTLQPADPAHICLVSDSMAENNVHVALSNFKVSNGVVAGSRYNIGKGVKQFVDGQLWWVFPVEFQDYFKWKQDKQVPGFLRVSAEDPQANPQAVQYNKKGEEIHIKYLNSACYEYQAERYLRHQGYFSAILDEFTFEVDDDWNPYYVVSVIERTTGYSGYRYKGIVLLDLQTGKNQFISKEELDSNSKWHWIDRGAPEDVLRYQIGKWGEYANSTWGYNFWHDDKSQKSGGDWYLVYSGNRCYFLTDMTSKNSDDALTGFTISEGASGKTIFYKAVGVTVKNASQAAIALWANYPGTSVAELVPYNIDGHMTYVAPMIKNKQYMGVSLVCMYDKNICAMGTTFDRALAKYRMSIDNAGHGRTVPNGGEETKKLEIVGEVGEVGMPVIIDQQQYFFFTIKNIDKSFEIPYSTASLAVPYLKSGKQVRLTYTETNEPVIICDELEIIGLNFSDKNPAQARYLSNQEVVKKEVGRIDKIQQTQEIINSDQMKQVDPAALKEFLEQQKNKQK